MKSRLLFAVLLISAASLQAGLIWTPGAAVYPDQEPIADYLFDASYDGMGAGVLVNLNLALNLLSAESYTLGMGQVWYSANAGDAFDEDYINSHDHFADNSSPDLGEIFLTPGESFYLAFRTEPGVPVPYVYGWLELYYDGSEITYVDSAAEDYGVGIIVGQYALVPEPGTLALALTSFLAMGVRKLRRRSIR